MLMWSVVKKYERRVLKRSNKKQSRKTVYSLWNICKILLSTTNFWWLENIQYLKISAKTY